jgi:hypothetical protein
MLKRNLVSLALLTTFCVAFSGCKGRKSESKALASQENEANQAGGIKPAFHAEAKATVLNDSTGAFRVDVVVTGKNGILQSNGRPYVYHSHYRSLIEADPSFDQWIAELAQVGYPSLLEYMNKTEGKNSKVIGAKVGFNSATDAPEVTTREELVGLRAQRFADFQKIADGLNKLVYSKMLENVSDLSQENVDEIFYKALDKAEKYALTLGATAVVAENTGILAKGLERRKINLIEVQDIFVVIVRNSKTEKIKVASVLPEAEHLRTLKTSEALFLEMKTGIDGVLKK